MQTIENRPKNSANSLRINSERTYQQLCEVIPGGVNSPVRACKGIAEIPLVAESASQEYIVDVDGKRYVDFCGSWGALIHGHSHPTIIQAAIERMKKGSTFGVTTPIEEKLARKITEIMPSIEKIRFVSSGTEATMSAVRLARGYTKKKYVIKFTGNYHGHADYFLVKAGSGVGEMCPESSSAGIPEELVQHMLCLDFNHTDQIKAVFKDERYLDKIAAVILEPIAGNMGVVPASEEFMHTLVKLCQKHQALLIFDEVMTGFRVHHKGAQELYKVKPDLTTLGKIVGGGFPAAAFGGRKEIMDHLAPLGPVYQAGTLSGNPVAMEAGLQSLTLLETPSFYENLNRKTSLITDYIQEAFEFLNVKGCVQRAGSMFTIFFGVKQVNSYEEAKQCDFQKFKRFFLFLLERGVYIPPLQLEAWFISSAHTEENLVKTRDLIIQFLKEDLHEFS